MCCNGWDGRQQGSDGKKHCAPPNLLTTRENKKGRFPLLQFPHRTGQFQTAHTESGLRASARPLRARRSPEGRLVRTAVGPPRRRWY